MPAIQVKDLVKKYKETVALKGISFDVNEGEIFGLIGPNGAGKTTTLRIIATLIKPTSGTVSVFGRDVVKDAEEIRKFISYLPEEAGAYLQLTGREYLEFMAKFVVKDEEKLRETIRLGIEIAGLGERIDDKIKTYSKGMKRRLLIARALMVKPRLAILDEPTSGLDVIHAYHVRSILREFAEREKVTMIVSSHNMLEIEHICDRVALIHRGKLLAIGTPKELKEKYNAANLEEVFVKEVGKVE